MTRQTRKLRQQLLRKLYLNRGDHWLRYEPDAMRAAFKQSEGVTSRRLFDVYWRAYPMALFLEG